MRADWLQDDDASFAWAANPPDPDQAPPSLRGADLSGADLAGANLSGADLTGVDMAKTNLKGAQLSGATVKDVKWSSTICPDGVNSDDSNGSCEGHLEPAS